MTTARLGFAVDSAQAKTASVDLDRLTASAGKAEKAERGLAGASQQTEKATTQAAAAARAYDNGLNAIGRALQRGSITSQQHAAALNTLNTRYQATAVAANVAGKAVEQAAMSTRFASHMTRQLSFQLIDIGQAIPLAFQSPLFALQNMGFQIAQIGQLYHGQGGMGAALRDSVRMVGRFAVKLAPIAGIAAAAGLGLAGLTHEINEAGDVTVSFGDTALATFQVVRDGVASILAPAFEAIAPIVQATWDKIVAGIKLTGNTVINSWRIVAEIVKDIFAEDFDAEGQMARLRAIWESDPMGEAFEAIAKRARENAQAYSEATQEVIDRLEHEHEALVALEGAHRDQRDGFKNAVDNANAAIETTIELRKAEVDLSSKAGQKIFQLVHANAELERSIKDIKDAEQERQKATKAVERVQEEAAKAGLDGVKLLMAERDLALKEFTEQKAKELGLEKEFAKARLAIEEIFQKEKAELEADAAEKAAEEARKAAEKQAEILRRPFENAIDGIQDSFTGFFENVFSGGVDSFKKLADEVQRIWIRMISELASQRLMQSLLGGGSGTAAGGGFNFGNVFSGLGGIFGGGGTPAAQLGAAASTGRAGGVGTPGVGGGFFSGGGTGGLSAAAAAIPVWGWIAAAAMTAKSFVEGSPRGSVGGVLDTLLLPSLDQWQANPGRSAINAFDPIGTAFGDVFGNDGASGILGGLLVGPGAFLGSIFDKKPSVGPNAFGRLRLDADGRLVQGGGNADNGGNVGQALQLADAVAGRVNSILDQLGAGFTGKPISYVGSFGGNLGVRSGGYNGGRFDQYFGNDPQALVEGATLQAFAKGNLTGVDPALADAIRQAGRISEDLEDFAANIGVAKAILDESLFGAEELTQAEQALNALNEQFQDAAERAERLGLSVAKLEDLREQALTDLTEGFDQGIRAQILALTDPVTGALENQARVAEERLREAEALGADLVEVERLNALERQRVLEQAGGNLKRFYEELTLGDLSGISPAATVTGLRASFEAAVAQGASQDRIAALGRDLLEASRGAFASSSPYQDDLARVLAVVESLLGDVPGFASGTMSAPRGLAFVHQGELIDFRGGERVYSAAETRRMASEEDRELAREVIRSNARVEAKLDELIRLEGRKGNDNRRLVTLLEARRA